MVRKQDNCINNFLILLEHCNSCVENTKKKQLKRHLVQKSQQKRRPQRNNNYSLIFLLFPDDNGI